MVEPDRDRSMRPENSDRESLRAEQSQGGGPHPKASAGREADAAAHLAQHEAILANAVDAIITIDDQGLIVSINPATERMFGYREDELIGRNVRCLMPSPYRYEHDGYLEAYRRTSQRKIIGIGREVEGCRRDGTVFPIHLAVSEIRVGARRLFTGIIRDISDLKQVENELALANEHLEQRVKERTEQLREAQEELVRREKLAMLGQVSGGIAHEIRNPLTAIKTSAFYLLHAKHAPPEKIEEHLSRIDRQVTIIDNVITALADVAMLPEPRLQPVDIGRCLQQVITSTTLPNNIEVVQQFDGSLPLALADPNQIPIVFRNLVRNARDAMPQGGRLTIRTALVDGKIEVAVIDEGIGIDDAEIQQIVEPLYSTKARGMGLGLAITRTILDKNHGELAIYSQVGQGSQFVVRLEASRDGDQ